MTKRPQRIFAAAAAFFFLFASLATSIAVIWAMTHQTKQGDTPVTDTTQNQTGPQAGDKLANFTPSTTPVAALQSSDTKVGDGTEAQASSTVTVLYTGAFVKDGAIFETSGQNPVSFPVNQVIDGWKEGVPGMKVGGVRRLVIPSAKAYGPGGSGKIPPNSDLVFDITLLEVK